MSDYSPEEIGAALKLLREARGWTNNKLALVAGIPPSSSNLIESGKSTGNVKNLTRICQALGITMSTFFAVVGGIPKPVESDELSKQSHEGTIELRRRVMKLVHENREKYEQAKGGWSYQLLADVKPRRKAT